MYEDICIYICRKCKLVVNTSYRNHDYMFNFYSFKVLSCDISCNGKYVDNTNGHGQYLVMNVTALNATEVVLIGYPDFLFWQFYIKFCRMHTVVLATIQTSNLMFQH